MSPVRVARKLAISILSLIVVFLCSEFVARLAEPGPMSLYDVRPFVKVVEPDAQGRGSIHEHIPGFEGRWDGTWYEINSCGFRGPELEPTFAPEEFRVVALGDSCTFGKGVLEQDCWPRQLERLLQQELPDREIMVANTGHNGYSSVHYLRMLTTKALDLRPDLVVLGYNVNDFPNITKVIDHRVYQGDKGLRATIPGAIREGMGTTAVYRWLRAAFYELRRESSWEQMERVAAVAVDPAAASEERYRSEVAMLREIVIESRNVGAEVMIFLFPYESTVYLDGASSAPVETVRRICAVLEVPFIDMTEEFREHAWKTDPPRRLFLRGDRYHPNAEGYGIVARAVAEAARERGLLEVEQ